MKLECASAVKYELARRGYQIVGGNLERVDDPRAIVIHADSMIGPTI